MPTFRQDNKLGDSVPLIKTPDIGDKQVTERKLADGSVTSSKLSTEIANMLSLLTTRISAFKVADNLSSLPTEENTIGWLVDNHLYVYVGNGSTPESGMYQDCGELRGPQGIQGEQGLSGLNGKSAYDIWTEQPGNEDKSEIDFLEFTRGSKGDKGDQGERGYDISNIEQIVKSTEDGGKNIIRVTRSDGWSKVFEILNGSKGSKGDKGTSIVKLEQTRKTTESSGLNTIEATLGDGTKESFEIYNGAKGEQGNKGEKGDKGDQGEIGPQGNSGIADASNKVLVNDAITGGETDFLSAEVGKLGILTYDCSKGGSVTHATLQDAINSVPTTFQKVGLTITYKSGDTIYRYTLKANAWSADPANWFSVEDKLSDLSSSYTEYKLKDYIHNPIIFHPTKSACFFGDSITYGYDADAENKRNENNYVSIFEKLTGIECTNYGENGISFTRISYNVRKTNLQGFNYCFIAGGRNDAANGLSYQEVRETINTLCMYLQENYPLLVVTFITPINEALQQHDSQLIDIRRAITEIAEKYSYNVIQGDSMPFSNGNSDILTQEVFCSDKIHPNTLGYKIYGETLYAKFLPFNKPERYLDIPFTQGSYFDIDGVLQNAEWAYNTEFDVTAKQGQRIIVQLLCKKNSLARCGFKNSDGVVLKTFHTAESNKDVFAITSEFIPYDAKTCFLSTQGNIGSDFGVIGYSKDRDNCVLFRMQGWYSLSKQADNNVVFQFNNIVCSVNGGDNCSVLSDGKCQIQNDSVLGIDISDFQYNVKRNFYLESITLKEYKDRKETFFPLIYYIAEAYGFSNYVIDNRSRFNDVAFTQGFRYDETGELVKEDWASCASFDVSDKHGLYLICKICAVQDLAFCGFKDSEGNVLSFFNSFNRSVYAREAFLTIEKIPETAKTCFLSSQTNVFENNRPEVVGYMSNLAFMGELENDINSVRHKKVICDTDFCGDVDDAVAIRILCHYESVGAFDILGVNMSEKSEYSSAAMSALLCESGRWNVPIAINKNATLQNSSYTKACEKYPRNVFSNEGVEDSLDFYLRALRTLPAGEKCDIICLGHLTCLADVLRTNKDLFNSKVDKIYFMGGNFSGYSKEYNISGVTGAGSADATVITDSNFVLNNATCDIIFCPFVYGGSIVAGKILKDKGYTEDILYKMLEAYKATDGRPVWDPITVLLAAQDSIEDLPGTSVHRGTVKIAGNGYTTFTKNKEGKHLLVFPTNKRALIKSLRLTLENNILLENLGNKSPRNRQLKQIYTGATEIELIITQQKYMDSNGNLQDLTACHYGEADISEHVGKKIYIEASSHGSTYCGFKDASGTLISSFQTDPKLEGFEAVYTTVVPTNAQKICITTQYSIIPIARCYVYNF